MGQGEVWERGKGLHARMEGGRGEERKSQTNVGRAANAAAGSLKSGDRLLHESGPYCPVC